MSADSIRVEVRKGSPFWVAVIGRGADRVRLSLKLKVGGRIGPDQYDEFSDAYVASRQRALLKAEKLHGAMGERHDEAQLIRRALKWKTSTQITPVRVSEIGEFYVKQRADRRTRSSGRALNQRYVHCVKLWFTRFADFLAKYHPDTLWAHDVEDSMAEEFHERLIGENFSTKSCRDGITVLRSGFRTLQRAKRISGNPFEAVRLETVRTQHKRTFSRDELARLRLAVQADDFLRPLFLCASSTGLRRGDVCLLEWRAVDLERRCLCLSQSKTEQPVEIPIVGELWEEICRRKTTASSKYVFPALAAAYRKNQDVVTERFQAVLKRIGFADFETRNRRGLRVKPARGKRAINVSGIHALRTTLATFALESGVPPALVKKITGHTSQVLEQSYFQPSLQTLCAALTTAVGTVQDSHKLPTQTQKHEPNTNTEPGSSKPGTSNPHQPRDAD